MQFCNKPTDSKKVCVQKKNFAGAKSKLIEVVGSYKTEATFLFSKIRNFSATKLLTLNNKSL